jgi:hypothetical protein
MQRLHIERSLHPTPVFPSHPYATIMKFLFSPHM